MSRLQWPDDSFLDLAKVDLPIVQAAIGGAAVPELAAAVSNAGGLGMLGLGGASADDARAAVRRTRALTDKPFGANLVLCWPPDDVVPLCLDDGVPVFSFFWGDCARFVAPAHRNGAIVMHIVGSVEEAHRAVDWGVDVIVAQGWEAGGHVRGTTGTMALVPAVVDAVGRVPVIAAGGIAAGRGVAAAFSLGAAGVWVGTRTLAATEAPLRARWIELDRLGKRTERRRDGDEMTELLEKAVEAVRQMPSERQDAIARWMLDLADEGAPEPLDPADIEAIEEGLADIERGDFATDAEVAAVFDRFRR